MLIYMEPRKSETEKNSQAINPATTLKGDENIFSKENRDSNSGFFSPKIIS